MTEQRTINDEIQDIINNTINQIAAIELVTISKVYTDNVHVDCELDTGDTLQYIPTISHTPTKNNKGLLIPLKDGTYYIITK